MEALITPVVYAIVAIFKNSIPENKRQYIPYVAFLLGGLLAGAYGALNGQNASEIFNTVLTGLALGFGASGLDSAIKSHQTEE